MSIFRLFTAQYTFIYDPISRSRLQIETGGDSDSASDRAVNLQHLAVTEDSITCHLYYKARGVHCVFRTCIRWRALNRLLMISAADSRFTTT